MQQVVKLIKMSGSIVTQGQKTVKDFPDQK